MEMTSLSAPLNDFELMLILHGNMRAGLKEKLAGMSFSTTSELFSACVQIENTWRNILYISELQMNLQSTHVTNSQASQIRSTGLKLSQNFRQVSEVEPNNSIAGEQFSSVPQTHLMHMKFRPLVLKICHQINQAPWYSLNICFPKSSVGTAYSVEVL